MLKKLTALGADLPIPQELVERRIHLIRGQKVMLSTDLAELYQTEPRALIQAVKRNLSRFPDDFMFQLNAQETVNLKSQNVISSWGGTRRSTPYAFTELGVAMLSSVLKSERAVQMNILIMRAFVRLRELLANHKDLAHKVEQIEAQQRQHTSIIAIVADEINKLKRIPPEPTKKPIGFSF